MALGALMRKTEKDHLKIMSLNLGMGPDQHLLWVFVRSRPPMSRTTTPRNQRGDGSQGLKEKGA